MVSLLLFTGIALPVDVPQFLTVIVSCGLVTDAATLDFGSVPPGVTSAETSVRVNNTGSTSTTVNPTGSAWYNSTNNFAGTQTHYNYTNSGQDYDTTMLALPVGTNTTIGSIANAGSKLVYYQVRIPGGTSTMVYRQDTAFSTVC
ncbi:MAG: hypothetical protein WC759_00550 [Candidatus Micrarchaeia archaeon]